MDLDNFVTRCEVNYLSTNINKFVQIKFSRSKHPINHNYKIKGKMLNIVNHVKKSGCNFF